MTLRALDRAGRTHELALALPDDFPASPPLCTTDLPVPFVPRPAVMLSVKGSGAFSLSSVVSQWESVMLEYQALWNHFDDLDDHTWVC